MSNCYFCHEVSDENPFSYKICELEFSKLYLFKEQIYPGRCILAAKTHAAEYYDLSEEEERGFFQELTMVSKVLEKLFTPDKMNYTSIGDSSGHLHVHIVPKRKDLEKWGDMFEVNAHRGYLEKEAYVERIQKIKRALEAQRKG